MILIIKKMSADIISDNYYDCETYNMLFETITDDDKEYMSKDIDIDIEKFIYKRWSMIVNSLPYNYYNQYYSQTTPEARNEWFKKYLDYPTKNILEMPDIL